PRAREHLGHRFEGRERRRDRHLAVAHRPDRLHERAREGHGLPPRAVHLPVADEERGAAHAAPSSSARRPGSSRPSRNSSEAPPPVDTWVTARSAPARRSAATESPPPTTVVPRQAASAAAIAIVPAANASMLKMPMGAFQGTVAAATISSLNRCAVAWLMSTPSRSAG